ncbi:MAG TPA: HD domain-containing protein [Stenomitos sp.]
MLTARYNEALEYAAWLHKDQVRKGTEIPYIAHPVAVSITALKYGATEEEAIAALLHDALEDQGRDGLTRIEILEKYGPEVLAIVEGCTDAVETPKPPWEARKKRYIASIAHKSASIRFVSACDKLHNAQAILKDFQAIGDALWERFKGGKEGTLWYYRALVEAFRAAGELPMLDALEQVVSELEAIACREEQARL